MSEPTTIVYRIVEVAKDGSFLTLFHGIKGSRRLPRMLWLRAENKDVSYGRGSPAHVSGFNVIRKLEDATRYLARFNRGKTKRDLVIVRCLARGLRPKPNAKAPVLLADELFIIEEVLP
jgi:hypothetical protein